MLDFVIKYWVQFLFGLAAACFTFVFKQYYKMKSQIKDQEIKDMKENMCTGMKAAMEEKINAEHELSAQADEEIKEDLMALRKESKADWQELRTEQDKLRQGVLAIQGKQFKDECRRLLNPKHEITLEEYENIGNEHETYHLLGGNHHGDALFKSVMKKWNRQLNPESIDFE